MSLKVEGPSEEKVATSQNIKQRDISSVASGCVSRVNEEPQRVCERELCVCMFVISALPRRSECSALTLREAGLITCKARESERKERPWNSCRSCEITHKMAILALPMYFSLSLTTSFYLECSENYPMTSW